MQVLEAVVVMQMICLEAVAQRLLHRVDVDAAQHGVARIDDAVERGVVFKQAQEILLIAQRLLAVSEGQVFHQHSDALFFAHVVQAGQAVLRPLQAFGLLFRVGALGIGGVDVHHVALPAELVVQAERLPEVFEKLVLPVRQRHLRDGPLVGGVDREFARALAHDFRQSELPVGLAAPLVEDFNAQLRGQFSHAVDGMAAETQGRYADVHDNPSVWFSL